MSKKINIGGVYIGGGESVKIQSMSTFKISDVEKSVEQCLQLKEAGVDIMRFSVLDEMKRRVNMSAVMGAH